MAIDDVRAGILESEIYDGVLTPVGLTITLLDLHSDTLPFAEAVRKEGAQAFEMLSSEPIQPYPVNADEIRGRPSAHARGQRAIPL
jgi:hypothetical protein